MTGKPIFIDTGAYLAYFCKKDQHYSKACELWDRLEDKQHQTITTNHVIDEVATLLARRTSYGFSANKLKEIYNSEYPVIIRPNQNDEKDAIRLFEKYADQEISFTDCLSFVVMKNMKIRQVFSFDRHFGILGFKVNSF